MPLQMLETCEGPGTSSTDMGSGLVRLWGREVGIHILTAVQGIGLRTGYDVISAINSNFR